MPNEITLDTSRMISPSLIVNGGERRIEPHRHVAAADVEADPGNADLLLIGDDAADRLRIAEVSVRTDHTSHDVADCHAIAHLSDRCFVVLAEHLERAILKFRCLRCDSRNLCAEASLFAPCVQRAPRRGRPCRPTAALAEAAIGSIPDVGIVLVHAFDTDHCARSCCVTPLWQVNDNSSTRRTAPIREG